MRLIQIHVAQLFGLFDHSVRLRAEDRITIIHGPNGFGKTALLQMVQGILTNQWSIFRRVPFKAFSVVFDDGQKLEVTRTTDVHKMLDREKVILRFQLSENNKVVHSHSPSTVLSQEQLSFPIDYIEHQVNDLERVGPELWLHIPSGRNVDLEDVVEMYGNLFPHLGHKERQLPIWLRELSKQFDVRLIEAQRLINLTSKKSNRYPENTRNFEPAVALYSRELASRIQEKQAAYGTFSQQLDSTFPTRVLQKRSPSPGRDELTKKLYELESKRKKIIEAGLLTQDKQASQLFGPNQPVDDSTKGILSLYAEDVENKLGVFDEMTSKIELFKDLVNKRFKYKQINIERQKGFLLSSSTGLPLTPADLSSGEQQELVLLYDLLFRTNPNALILLDEPELSLHVAWQVEFLNDLERVIELSPFDVVLATHSPQIINNRWDLTEALVGPDL